MSPCPCSAASQAEQDFSGPPDPRSIEAFFAPQGIAMGAGCIDNTHPIGHIGLVESIGGRSPGSRSSRGRVRPRSQGRLPTHSHSFAPAGIDQDMDDLPQPKRTRSHVLKVDLGVQPETATVNLRLLGPKLQQRFSHLFSAR